MKTKLSTLALIACLGSALAFAGEKDKSKHSNDDANAANQPAATETAKQDNENGTAAKHKKKMKNQVKPAPTTQEQQFDEVLRGIWG